MCKLYNLDEVASLVEANDEDLKKLNGSEHQLEKAWEARILKAEIRERLARLELIEYQMYQDTCFLDKVREDIRKIEL
jgi:hypothetical protein